MIRKTNTLILVSFIVIAAVFTSCRREQTCTINCDLTYDLIAFGIGYTDADLDTLVVNEYAQGSNFSELKSTKTAYPFNYITSDSQRVFLAKLSRYSDWELYIPSTKKTYRIANIKQQDNPTKTGACKAMNGCYNEIVSFDLDGVTQYSASVNIHK